MVPVAVVFPCNLPVGALQLEAFLGSSSVLCHVPRAAFYKHHDLYYGGTSRSPAEKKAPLN